MSYTALYRKFRPKTFSEIVGQEHITRTLKNQIMAERVGHAYLFNGGRGTGKTSAAKVLARAINCLNPKDGEPCNTCEICRAALSGSLTDIVEMDAASNNSVEDIRSIREEVNFLPTLAKYRVYIIDEVHMLSTGAFNALLKTLEEPPEHVKFILATTEPQKLPATILSRCQRFDFKRIPSEDIQKRLAVVCNESNIEITEEALQTIAILAEGGMRDALSILERCMQDGDTKVEADKVKDLVGIPKTVFLYRMLECIVTKNPEKCLQTIEEILKDGKDIQNLVWEMIKYTKDMLIYKVNGTLTLYRKEEIEQIKELAEHTTKDRIFSIIYALSDLENRMKWSSQKTILVESEMIKLCMEEEMPSFKPETAPSGEDVSRIMALESRVRTLENTLKQLSSVKTIPEEKGNTRMQEVVPKNPPVKKNTTVKKSDTMLDNAKPVEFWPKVMDELKQNGKMMLYTNLIHTNAKELNDMTIGIEFPNGMTAFGKTVLEKQDSIAELTKLVSMECGKQMRIQYIDGKSTKIEPKQDSNTIENVAKGFDIPIDIIE